MGGSELESRIERLLAPSLEAMGYGIVRVRLAGRGAPTLQIMAERLDGSAITLDECTAISRTASALLDVEDPLQGAYTLEVSSPGIDRPLVRPRDYERFAGFEVRAETTVPLAGRRRFRGRLLGLAEGKVKIAMPEGTVELPLDGIEKARLVLNDELLAAADAQRRAANERRR